MRDERGEMREERGERRGEMLILSTFSYAYWLIAQRIKSHSPGKTLPRLVRLGQKMEWSEKETFAMTFLVLQLPSILTYTLPSTTSLQSLVPIFHFSINHNRFTSYNFENMVLYSDMSILLPFPFLPSPSFPPLPFAFPSFPLTPLSLIFL